MGELRIVGLVRIGEKGTIWGHVQHDEDDDRGLLWTPGRGYEQQGVQGNVIYGGAPRK